MAKNPILESLENNLLSLYPTQDRPKKRETPLVSHTPPMADGSVDTSIFEPNGFSGTRQVLSLPFGSFDAGVTSYRNRVFLYRAMSRSLEVSRAIEDIVNESIVMDNTSSEGIVQINLDDADIPDGLKTKLTDAFDHILKLMNFNRRGQKLFQSWYVDGRISFEKIIDRKRPKEGLQKIKQLQPENLVPIRRIIKGMDPENPQIEVVKRIEKFYAYTPDQRDTYSHQIGTGSGLGNKRIIFKKNAICDVNSDLFDGDWQVISYLDKAIRPYNQLRSMEDSLVIYRISRAPERRIFYVDTGNLPRAKAEQYIKDIMANYKNKIVYNATTGTIQDAKNVMTIQDDFWLPRSDGKGTEVSTLPGGCLAMDTKVSLLDGRELSISEIETEMSEGKELWTYSCDPETGKIVPGLISWAGVTQESAKVIRLTLDNGETLICTPDHKFPVHGKGFVRADELGVGESMMAKSVDMSMADMCLLTDIEMIEDEIPVGTLTIDNDEVYHDYHTFALTIGIFTKNSNLGDMEDVTYFQQKLYEALNVPKTRLQSDTGFQLGRATEITRDEVNFKKFIGKLRTQFSYIFLDLLKTHLILTGTVSADEWEEFEHDIGFDYTNDSFFFEMKQLDVYTERMNVLAMVDPFVGKYYSKETVEKEILGRTEEEVKEEQKRMDAEIKSGDVMDPIDIQKAQMGMPPDGGFPPGQDDQGDGQAGQGQPPQPGPPLNKGNPQENQK